MSEKRCKKHAAVFDHRIVVESVDDSECPVCNPQICAKGIDTDLVRNCADEYPDKTQKIEDLCDEIDTLREQLAQEQRDHDATKAELARMREALASIGNMPIGTQVWTLKDMARTALKGGANQ